MIHADLVGERARLSPDRDARWSWSTAATASATGSSTVGRSGCARMWLYGLGLRPGDRVGVLSGNRIEFLDTFFAAGKSGIVLVPLNTRLTAPELEFIIRDCGAQGADVRRATTARPCAG